MKQREFTIKEIPALLLGETSDNVYLFVHGQCGRKEEARGFAELANKRGWQVLSIDLPEHGARIGKAEELNPWSVVPELRIVMKYINENWTHIALQGNSIGAWFSMLALGEEKIEKALFVSPMVDMERLILNMMQGAKVTEEKLQEKGEIKNDFGETLSWRYLCYVREHPITWNVPTQILYGGGDHLVDREVMNQFVTKYHASLTVMEDGEHWFHTEEQLKVLIDWEKENL